MFYVRVALLMIISLRVFAAGTTSLDDLINSTMKDYQIPGMVVGISVAGKQQFLAVGVADKESKTPVTVDTLFEIGSLSKTFTATLAEWVQQQGKLDFDRPVSHYLPTLRNTAFDDITLRNLATHTSGLPLFVPENITQQTQLMAWLHAWKPAEKPGTERVYSNIGIGILGVIAAQQWQQPFPQIMAQQLLPGLGLTSTYVQVPADKIVQYAQGYDKQNQPARLTEGPLAPEAYGLRSSARDLLHYLELNIGIGPSDASWRQAIQATHTGWYRSAEFTQAGMWESYSLPVDITRLLDGNNSTRLMKGVPALAEASPAAGANRWYNKTGSTAGFSTYAVFIPAEKTALIMVANKWFPNDARVALAYRILQQLH